MGYSREEVPTPADGSMQSLDEFLTKLEKWHPKPEDKELAKERIEYLDKAMPKLKPSEELWIRTLRRLAATCRRSLQLPDSCAQIPKSEVSFEENEKESGGQADVHRAMYQNRAVALKNFRVDNEKKIEITKMYLDEVVMWKWVNHENIVPFVGVSSTFELCIVSEWMDNGTIVDFLTANPMEHRHTYMKDIMTGLNYIHSLGVIHADLKGNNILVSSHKRALLADFGISVTSSSTHTKVGSQRGSQQYKAPELDAYNPKTGAASEPTLESDYFALAHVFWQMFTLDEPYAPDPPQRPNMQAIQDFIKGNNRPGRPKHMPRVDLKDVDMEALGLTDEIWDAIDEGWDRVPATRVEAWKKLVKLLDVPPSDVDAEFARIIAREIKEEEPKEEPRNLQGGIRYPRWGEWPFTHMEHRHLVTRGPLPPSVPGIKLHELIDVSTWKPMYDLSWHEKWVMQEGQPPRRPRRDPRDDQEFLVRTDVPADRLSQAPVPGQTIRYIDVTCALLPGWKGHIHANEFERPFTPEPSFKSVQFSDEPGWVPPPETGCIPSSLLCGLPSFWRRTRSRKDKSISPPHAMVSASSSRQSLPDPGLLLQPRISTPSLARRPSTTELPASSTHSAAHEASSDTNSDSDEEEELIPPVPPLAPPVSDDQIENLRPLTVDDVFHGIFNALHRRVWYEEYRRWPDAKLFMVNSCFRRRCNRLSGKDSTLLKAMEGTGIVKGDLLVDEVMFDGLIPTKVDGKGGLEVELITRLPTERELAWYNDTRVMYPRDLQ